MKSPVRIAATVLVVMWAGCFGSQSETASLDGADDPSAPPECFVNTDCVPAGPSCCDSWTHSVPGSTNWEQSCEDVNCPNNAVQPNAGAVCESGSCVLQCSPVVCDQTFTSGYASDSFGCLICESAGETTPPSRAECVADTDCVRIAADCCGCANGGTDTAVAASDLDDYLGGLGCKSSPSCPGVDVCQADLAPRCLNNACALLPSPAPDLSPDAGTGVTGGTTFCGSADLPPCAEGQVCVLNAPGADDASMNGLGICQDP